MIFISYSSANQVIANKINDSLKKAGFKTWFAKDSIKAGQNYAGDIVKAIQYWNDPKNIDRNL